MRDFYIACALSASIILFVLATDSGDAMEKCQEKYSFDTCHYQLNH